MKPEIAERLYIEGLLIKSIDNKRVGAKKIVSLEKLTGDASTRKYYRVFTDTSSFVVCLDNPSKDKTTKNSFVEMQSFLSKRGIRVPEIYDMELERGYILEEDLGDVTLLQALSEVGSVQEEYEYYKEAIDIILKMQKISQEDFLETEFLNREFDFEKLYDEVKFSVDYFIEHLLGVSSERIKKQIAKSFKPLIVSLSSEPKVFTHRDYHSRNLMVKKNELITIDFQDARKGPAQYDLVSLLEDCYYDLNSGNKEKIIDYYFNQMPVEQSREKFDELYDQMLIQRVFKAIGSFSYIFHIRKDKRYLKYIGFAMEKLKLTLMKYPEYNELRKNLFKIYYAS